MGAGLGVQFFGLWRETLDQQQFLNDYDYIFGSRFD